jgi:hypothetical protein
MTTPTTLLLYPPASMSTAQLATVSFVGRQSARRVVRLATGAFH